MMILFHRPSGSVYSHLEVRSCHSSVDQDHFSHPRIDHHSSQRKGIRTSVKSETVTRSADVDISEA